MAASPRRSNTATRASRESRRARLSFFMLCACLCLSGFACLNIFFPRRSVFAEGTDSATHKVIWMHFGGDLHLYQRAVAYGSRVALRKHLF